MKNLLNLFLIFLSISFGINARSVTLVMWEHESDDTQKILDEINARYVKKHQDIEIKRSHYKVEDLRTQFQNAAMGGGGADILLAPNDVAGPFSVMGIIKDVKDWGKLERFSPAVVQAITDDKKSTWGLPISKGNHLMLLVNKKLVPRAPTTIEELVAAAKKISAPKKNKFGFAYNLTEPFFFVPFMSAYGERPLLPGGKPNLNNDGMIKALALVKKFKFEYKIVPPDCDYVCADTLFKEGKVGMIINGDWEVESYKNILKDSLLIAPLPMSKETGKHMEPMVSGKYLFYNKNLTGTKLAAAQAYGEYLTSKEVQEELLSRTGRLPALKELDNSPALTSNKIFSATNAAMAHGQPMPINVEMRVVWDAIRPQLQAVMAGRTEPAEAAKIMQTDAEKKIKEMKE